MLRDTRPGQDFPIAGECVSSPLKPAVSEGPLQRLALRSRTSHLDVPPVRAGAGVGLGQETSGDGFGND